MSGRSFDHHLSQLNTGTTEIVWGKLIEKIQWATREKDQLHLYFLTFRIY